jgi:hypothetical protein
MKGIRPVGPVETILRGTPRRGVRTAFIDRAENDRAKDYRAENDRAEGYWSAPIAAPTPAPIRPPIPPRRRRGEIERA